MIGGMDRLEVIRTDQSTGMAVMTSGGGEAMTSLEKGEEAAGIAIALVIEEGTVIGAEPGMTGEQQPDRI